MDVQLQELIDKIKKDGVSAAEKEAAKIIANSEKKAEAIIEEETILLKDALKEMEITPILSSLNVEAEKIRKNELEKTLKMLDLSDKDAKKLDLLTHSIVDKMLFNTIKNLKQAVINDDDETINAAKKILIEYPQE